MSQPIDDDLADPVEYCRQLKEKVDGLMMGMKQRLVQLNAVIRAETMRDGQMCDVGFFMRELEDLFDEMRKDVAARRRIIGEMLGRKKAQEFAADPSVEMTIRGQHSTGVPDVSTRYRLPRPGSPEYILLLERLGVSQELVGAGVFKLDFNGLADFGSARELAGHPIVPKEIGKFTEFTTVFRRKDVKKRDKGE